MSSAVALSYDLALVAVCHQDTIEVLDANSSERLREAAGLIYGTELLAFSNDSTRLASAQVGHCIQLWDIESAYSPKLEGDRHQVMVLRLTKVATRIVSVSSERIMEIWDIYSGQCLKTLISSRCSSSAHVRQMSISNDARRVATITETETEQWLTRLQLQMWHTNRDEFLQTLVSSWDVFGRYGSLDSTLFHAA